MGMGHVAVGEDHVMDALPPAKRLQFRLVHDRDALRIEASGEGRGIPAPADARDLGGGEGDDLDGRIVPVGDIEVVKVAPGRPQDHDPPARVLVAHCLTPRKPSDRSRRDGVVLRIIVDFSRTRTAKLRPKDRRSLTRGIASG
jgi:hypothetical protein